MGLHVLSTDGMVIKRVKQWVLKCIACFKITTDLQRQFCPVCGNHTLERVACSLDKDSEQRTLYMRASRPMVYLRYIYVFKQGLLYIYIYALCRNFEGRNSPCPCPLVVEKETYCCEKISYSMVFGLNVKRQAQRCDDIRCLFMLKKIHNRLFLGSKKCLWGACSAWFGRESGENIIHHCRIWPHESKCSKGSRAPR